MTLQNGSGERLQGSAPQGLEATKNSQDISREAPGVSDAPAPIKSVLTAAATPPGAEGFRLADDVLLLVAYDGSGRLIDLSGNVSALTESGVAMLELALRHGIDAAGRRLAERYGVADDVIRTDMSALFQSLEQQRVLVPVSVAARKLSLRRALSWMFYPLVLMSATRPMRRTRLRASLLMTWTFLAIKLSGWSHTARVWGRASAKLNTTRPDDEASRSAVAAIDAAVTQALATHPLPVSCKERALTAWVLARAAGVPARVQLGVELFPFGLHCWCESGSQIIADRYEGRCDRYTPILSYG